MLIGVDALYICLMCRGKGRLGKVEVMLESSHTAYNDVNDYYLLTALYSTGILVCWCANVADYHGECWTGSVNSVIAETSVFATMTVLSSLCPF